MKYRMTVLAMAAALCVFTTTAFAQTADEVVEKHLAAMGGRAALTKVTSQIATGTISVGTQMGDITGSVEVTRKAPNKSRTLTVLDLSALGAASMTIDQRFDGQAGWVGNTMQGDRDITGGQLQSMKNSAFPTPLLNYKETGGKVELAGKDTVGGRNMLVLVYTPKEGPAAKFFVDAETYLIAKSVSTIDVPEAGGPMEQASETSDYRDVGGLKLPFSVKAVTPVQTVVISISKIEVNKAVDDALFVKPAK
jgi:outer membrane lipoprotein-sorting protein